LGNDGETRARACPDHAPLLVNSRALRRRLPRPPPAGAPAFSHMSRRLARRHRPPGHRSRVAGSAAGIPRPARAKRTVESAGSPLPGAISASLALVP
jgi:hypothetical protein